MSAVQTDNMHDSLRVDCRRLSRHLETVLDALARPEAIVDVRLVDDAEIQTLNLSWRGMNAVTDVLSFALEDDDDDFIMPPQSPQTPQTPQMPQFALLGDIVISLDTARRQAAEMRIFLGFRGLPVRYSLWQETCFLATHGVLHLLGYDHQTAEQAQVMEDLERRFIATVTTAPVHEMDRSAHGQ